MADAPDRPRNARNLIGIPPRFGQQGRDVADDILEREADERGASIGAELNECAVREGSLSAMARQVAERHLGTLPAVTVREAASGALKAQAVASAHGSLIQLRPGALSSTLPFYRAVLGHELVHIAQQRVVGPRIQNLTINGVKVPEVDLRPVGDDIVLSIDKVPVLQAPGPVQVRTDFNQSALQLTIVVQVSGGVTPLRQLSYLNAMYPALEGRLVLSEPGISVTLPREGELPRSLPTPRLIRVFGVFGRTPQGSAPTAASPPSAARAGGPHVAETQPTKPPASADTATPLADQDKNPYRSLSVPERLARVKALLDKWFTSHDILQVFQASSTGGEFLALEKACDFEAVLDKLTEWDIIRLAASGPILPQYSGRVNRVRADYVERISREWGAQRAEVFTLYICDTSTDDEIEALLTLLAGDQELYRTVQRMPLVKQRLLGRGIDLDRFKDRSWRVRDIATGAYHALDSVMSTAPAAADAKGFAAFQQGMDLPDPYRTAVHDLDMAAFEQALTPGNAILGGADLALLGLPSTVKGIVYDLPRSVISGVDELSQGHVVAGVEMLTVPVVLVISAALGVRAYRRARVATLLELTGEGKALYNTLKSRIGGGGINRVAAYVQKSSAARILVAEAGAEGIVALDVAKGDAAAARALLAERQALMQQAGSPSGVVTGQPGTLFARPNEIPYTSPPDAKVARLGSPLDVGALDPAKRYLWVLDEEGNFRVASEGQGNAFPKRRPLPSGHPQAGQTPLKHGDLTPGPDGMIRGRARAGGELLAEFGSNGKPTGRWFMNLESSYAFARLDGATLTLKELNAAHRLLGTTGTDITKIVPKM